MANRFRTELTRVPPVRIGVGRQGLTTTIDWAGDASGPAYAGLSPSLKTLGNAQLAGPLPTDRYLIPGTRTDYSHGDVSRMTSPGLEGFKALLFAASQRRKEIRGELGKAKWQLGFAWATRALGWATLASAIVPPVRKAAQRGVAVRRQEIATLRGNQDATPISVDFDMDSEVGLPHRRMQEAFDRIVACQRRWAVQTSQKIDRVKARSYAGTVVMRQSTVMDRSANPLVNTADTPLSCAVQGGRSTAYFYPGFVLVASRDGSDFALIDLVDLDVRSAHAHFTETEAVPSDAVAVGSTWAKANKNGTRDKRFANNRQLPILRYGELQLSASGGLQEAFMISRSEPCDEFASAAQELKRILASAKSTRSLGVGSRRAIRSDR